MGGFSYDYTYQEKKTTHQLETCEWDRLWMDRPSDDADPHVLILGDSISDQYRKELTRYLNSSVHVNGWATSKAVNSPFLLPSIMLVAQQLPRCDAILFNNGLHGWHQSVEEYYSAYNNVLDGLAKFFPDTPLALVLTTPVRKSVCLEKLGERPSIVQKRNARVLEIARKRNFPLIDFFSAVVDHPECWENDGVHFVPAGCEVLAQIASEQIKKML